MSATWLLTNFVATFLLPPLNLLIVGVVGLMVLKRRKTLGKALIAVSLIGLWALSTPLVAKPLLDTLNPPYRPLAGQEADAIVILGGGRDKDSIEYGGDTLKHYTLERLRYGAWLARRLGKPILVAGGAPDGGIPEGVLMRDALVGEYRLPVQWVEQTSRNTRENARFSARLLKQAGVRRIYLVTHAWHLARAVPEFEREGLRVVPAGTGYSLPDPPQPLDFLPGARGMTRSAMAMHEWIGVLWYRIRN